MIAAQNAMNSEMLFFVVDLIAQVHISLGNLQESPTDKRAKNEAK